MVVPVTEGDKVWLETCNLSIKGNKKLSQKHVGPFTIDKKISSIAFQLDLPPLMKIHNVFHADLLLPYKEMEAYRQTVTRPPPILESGEEEYEIESIIEARRTRHGHEKLQYLIHWKGYPHANNSWVDHKDLHAPDLLKEFYLQNPAVAG